ncbi:hypothetical protein K9M79_08680 [Candidatus Woesearchaeota archaeon]|nr:hypothetical protein [Candidatus Woesearchaeota archaeon]
MASILDISLLENFKIWFTIVFVFVIVYAILQSTKLLGDKKPLHAIIAVCIAFLFLFSETSVIMVSFLAPWLTVVLIFTVMLLMFYKLFGASAENLQNLITHHNGIIWTIAVLGIVLLLVAFGYARGQVLLEETQGQNSSTIRDKMTEGAEGSTDSGDAVNNAYMTIFHPKVLGLIFTLLVAVFGISMLTSAGRPPWPPMG